MKTELRWVVLSLTLMLLALAAGCEKTSEVEEAFANEPVSVVTEPPEANLTHSETDAVTEAEVPAETSDTTETETSAEEVSYLLEPAPTVRGFYATSNRVGIPSRLDELLALCDETGVNAMVIDVRTENEITLKNWIPFADEWEISVNYIPDVTEVMAKLEAHHIYPIARIVTFLDDYTVEHRPELYIHDKDGAIWLGPVHNGKRYPWLNPYNRDTWDYVLTYAKAAAELGFKEIQFDYVRFAATSRLEDADFGNTGGLSRIEIIKEFLMYAKSVLRPYGVRISADVYGTIINSDLDASIVGQDYTELARILDVICPMIYPSHFAGGTFGIKNPDTEPYKVVNAVLLKSAERLSVLPEDEPRAIVRPWLQDFTATWVNPHLNYAKEERQAQIEAVYDAGLLEWLLWDPRNNYDSGGIFFPE